VIILKIVHENPEIFESKFDLIDKILRGNQIEIRNGLWVYLPKTQVIIQHTTHNS
jgi:hypothetical protein